MQYMYDLAKVYPYIRIADVLCMKTATEIDLLFCVTGPGPGGRNRKAMFEYDSFIYLSEYLYAAHIQPPKKASP